MPAAAAELHEITEHLGPELSDAVRKFIRSVNDAVKTIQTFPEAGTLVPKYAGKNVREKLAGAYRLVYRVHPTRISIVALFHSARNFPAAWRAKPNRFRDRR
jgi:plasmid stabilization system protein ParE